MTSLPSVSRRYSPPRITKSACVAAATRRLRPWKGRRPG
jgi:hypothetical protein